MVAAAFESELTGALQDAKPTARGTRVLGWLTNGRKGPVRKILLHSAELHARDLLGKPTGAIDWSAIDWSALLKMLLPILLALFGL